MEKGLYAGGVNKMQHKTILAQGGMVHYWIIKNENVSQSFSNYLSRIGLPEIKMYQTVLFLRME